VKLVFGNTAWVDAPERFVLKRGHWKMQPLRVRFGLVLHPVHGPVLIDTGYTNHALSADNRSRGLRLYYNALKPRLVEEEQPAGLLAAYGYVPEDVKFVIVTHFHADHISGLKAFCQAQFIASGLAWQSICSASAFHNLRHGIFTELIPEDFEDRLLPIEKCPNAILNSGTQGLDIFGDGLLVACHLPSHAKGHYGVELCLPSGPVLYAVDTQWRLAALLNGARPRFPTRLIADDSSKVETSSDWVCRYQEVTQAPVILCHDPAPTDFDYCSNLQGN
jgi:glyoxylase-like metal-dependent hydrolase (beta-lactamase superfamily II)